MNPCMKKLFLKGMTSHIKYNSARKGLKICMCIGGEIKGLTHCGLLAAYDNKDLGQHWFR